MYSLVILVALAVAVGALAYYRGREGWSPGTQAAIEKCRRKGKVWNIWGAKGKKCQRPDKREDDPKIQKCINKGFEWAWDPVKRKCHRVSEARAKVNSYKRRGFTCPPDKLFLRWGDSHRCITNSACFNRYSGKNVQDPVTKGWRCECGPGTTWNADKKNCDCLDNFEWDGSTHTCHPRDNEMADYEMADSEMADNEWAGDEPVPGTLRTATMAAWST